MKEISAEEAESLLQRSQQVEAEKAAKQAERLEKKRQKELQKKQAFMEKLVAPVLLALTILVSFILLASH